MPLNCVIDELESLAKKINPNNEDCLGMTPYDLLMSRIHQLKYYYSLVTQIGDEIENENYDKARDMISECQSYSLLSMAFSSELTGLMSWIATIEFLADDMIEEDKKRKRKKKK